MKSKTMPGSTSQPETFSDSLQRILCGWVAGIDSLEPYEFRYALDNLTPRQGWESLPIRDRCELLEAVRTQAFYSSVQLKPLDGPRIALDPEIVRMTQELFIGLVRGSFDPSWVDQNFFFDLRAFIYFVRTQYLDEPAMAHLGGHPVVQFEPKQKLLLCKHEIGYRDFALANSEVDQYFFALMENLVRHEEPPITCSIAGPSGSGKTEVIARLRLELQHAGHSVTTVELDNFLKDGTFRDQVEGGLEILHYDLLKKSLQELASGRTIEIPRYDFSRKESSHDLNGTLRPGKHMLRIEPADVILLEGNLPLHVPGLAEWAGIKIVYLTDDPIRLKRKWFRDIDLRKKYDPRYFCNRFFRTQFLRANQVYQPLLNVCEVLVDTTNACVWVTPDFSRRLGGVE